MRVTLHTDYALRVLIFLAVRPGQRVATQVIAESYGISLNHLHKVVRALGELGHVALHRGAHGGIELAADPDQISIGAVVRALDDDSALVECFRPDTKQCVISPACALQGALRSAQAAFYAELDPLTLGALVQGRAASKLRALTGD